MKTAFHNVGKLYERDGEFKLKHFTHGTFYSKETSKGLILVNEDGDKVGYLRPISGRKVSAYITWCDGDRTYQCFPDDDNAGEYNVTCVYEYDDSERQSQPQQESEGRKDRW